MANDVRFVLSIDGSSQVAGELRRVSGAMAETASHGDRAADALRRVGHYGAGLLALGGVGQAVRNVAGLADEFATLNGRLRSVTDGQQQFVTAQRDVADIAERQRKGLSDIGALYASATAAASELGASQQQVAKFTEGVAASLTLNGTSAQAAAGALLQLSQAVGGSVVQAQEFNSLIDGARPLLVAAAKNIDEAGGSVNRLKELVNEGKISSAAFFQAIVKGSDELTMAAAKMPTTIGQSLTLVRNEWVQLVGAFDAGTGASSGAAAALALLANNLGTLAVIAGGAAAVGMGRLAQASATAVAASLAERAARVGALAATVRQTEAIAIHTSMVLADARATLAHATGLGASVVAQNAVTAASARHTAALAAQAAAQTALSRATSIGAAAMGLLGGPVGLVATALGLGATAWAAWSAASKRGTEEASADTRRSTDSIVADLTRQAEKLEALNRLRLQPGGTAVANAGGDDALRLAQLGDSIAELMNKTGKAAVMHEEARKAVLQATLKEYASLDAAIRRVADAEAERGKLSRDQQNSEYLKKYATDAERLSAALQKARDDFGGVIPPDIEQRIRGSFTKPIKAASSAADDFRKSLADQLESLREQYIELTQGKDAALAYKAAQLGASAGTEAQRQKIAGLSAAIEQHRAAIETRRKAEEEAARAHQAYLDGLDRSIGAQAQANAKLREELDVLKLGRDAYDQKTLARDEAALAAMEANMAIVAMDEAELARLQGIAAMLREQIDLRKEIAGVTAEKSAAEAAKTAQEESLRGWQQSVEQMGQSLSDALMDGGKSAADYLKGLFRDLVLRPILQPVATAFSSAISGTAAAAGGGTDGAGSMLGSLGQIGGMLGGIGGAIGTFGSSVGTGVSATLGGAGLGGLLSRAGSMMTGESMAGGLGTATGAILPYAVAALTIYQIYKSLKHERTPHTGGAAMGTALGASASSWYDVTGVNKGFKVDLSDKASAGMASLSQSIAQTLQPLATLAGAGAVHVGTAFADDKSKDSAWGAFRMTIGGKDAANWNGTEQGFSDGEKGYKEFVQRIADDTRGAIDSLNLPAWARSITDGLKDGATLDDIQAAVTQIGELAQMGEAFQQLGKIGGLFRQVAGSGIEAQAALVAMAGGADALTSSMQSFYQEFYSEAERSANATGMLGEAFADLGLAVPATRGAYRDLVEAQDLTTESGRQTYVTLLGLADTFAELHPVVETAAGVVEELGAVIDGVSVTADRYKTVMSERDSLEGRLLQLQGDTTAMRGRELEATDPLNRALLQLIFDTEDATTAANTLAETERRISTERQSLETRLLQLQGDTAELRQRELDALDPSNRALLDLIFSLEDAATAAGDATTAANALAEMERRIAGEREGLESRLLQLQGNTAELRRRELDALDPANRALLSMIFTLEDAATAAQAAAAVSSNRYSLEGRLLQLQGNTAALRARELAETPKANRALLQSIFALEDKIAAEQAAAEAARASAAAAAEAARASEQLRDAWRSIGETIADEVRRLRGLTDAGSGAGFAALQAQFATTTAQARAGDQEAARLLPDISRQLTEAGEALAASAADLAFLKGTTAASLERTLAGIAPLAGVPGFAAGGLHGGGLRIVGEHGPELELTGPSRILTPAQMSDAFGSGALAAEIAELRREVARLREDSMAAQATIAANTRKTARILESVTPNGDAIVTEAAP